MISLEKRTSLSLKKMRQVGNEYFSTNQITGQNVLSTCSSLNNKIIRPKFPSYNAINKEITNNQLEANYQIISKLYYKTNASIKPLYPYSRKPEKRSRCQILKSDNILLGNWKNSYISAAIPLLLQVERMRTNSNFSEIIEIQIDIARKIHHFNCQLNKQGHPPEEIEHLSYLLCTYIDGIDITKDISEEFQFHLSLLMEFHNEAWGGANCFTHLKNYLPKITSHRNILEFYYLIISLGFEGKYKMLEQGSILLMELRTHLNTLLYGQNAIQQLTVPTLNPTTIHPHFIKILKIGLSGLVILLFIYGISVWYLNQSNSQVDSASHDCLRNSGVIEYTDSILLERSSSSYPLTQSEKITIAMADRLRDNTSINQTHNRDIIAIKQGENEPISDNTTRDKSRLIAT